MYTGFKETTQKHNGGGKKHILSCFARLLWHDKHCWQMQVRHVFLVMSKIGFSPSKQTVKGSRLSVMIKVSWTKHLCLYVMRKLKWCVFLGGVALECGSICKHELVCSRTFSFILCVYVCLCAGWLGALTALGASSALGFLSPSQNLSHE